jgi:hypothetical protein
MEEHSSYGKYADLNKSLTNYAPIEVAEAICLAAALALSRESGASIWKKCQSNCKGN